jgi:putative transposase
MDKNIHHAPTRPHRRTRHPLAHDPRDYRWSSYRCNAEGKANPLINPHHEHERLGRTAPERCTAYRHLISAHIDPEYIAEIRAATNGNYVLGNNRFKEEISRMIKRRVTPGKAGRRVRGEDEKR